MGAGTFTLAGANTHTGGTTINSGTLRTQNASALGSGAVALQGGTLEAVGTLNIASLNWSAGTLQLAPAVADIVNVANALTNGGGGGAFTLNATGLAPGTYTLATFGTTNFAVADFSATFLNVPVNVTLQGQFLLNANNLQFTLAGFVASGPLLQNRAPVSLPAFADFVVDGAVETGGPDENNTVHSLTFLSGSSLTVHNTLTVTNNLVNVVGNSRIHLDGTLSASQLNILVAGLLDGNGTISGNLLNRGTVSPGNSPGTIHVGGNYTQTPTGTLRIEIAGRQAGQHDLLRVDGGASLNGTLQLVRLNNFNLKRGDRIEFLTAAQGVEGEFATVLNEFTSATILKPTLVYGTNSVALEMVQGSFAVFAQNAGLTPNQRAVAGALDSVVFDPRQNALIAHLDEQPLPELPADFDRIAPEELTSIFTIGTSLEQISSGAWTDLRSGATGFSAAGLAMQGTGPGYSGHLGGAAGPSGKDGKEIHETKLTREEAPRWGAFLTGQGEWVNVGSTYNAEGYDITTSGFTLGLDYRVCPNFAIGISAGYAGTGADLTGGGSVLVNGGQLGLYATTFIGGWYADVAVNGGYNNYDTKRSALQGTARGSTGGGEINVLVGTGYDWKAGALTIGPTATYSYTLVGIDSFTERGSLAPLKIHNRNAESIRTALGFKASYDWKVAGLLVKPELRLAWQHEYGDSSYALDASFANGGGTGFLVNGPEVGRDSLLLGVGFAIQFSERCSTYLYYDAEFGRKEYDRQGVSGGFRIAF